MTVYPFFSPDTEAEGQSCLSLTLLGGVGATWQQDRLAVSAPRMLGVLAYLHLRGPTPRTELSEVFWPGQGARAVRQALYTLRGLPGAAQWLTDGPEVQLHARSDVGQIRQLLHDRADAEALALLSGAGPLLGHLNIQGAPAFEEWLGEQRSELESAYQAALRRQARVWTERQEYALARDCLERLLQLDPLEEQTYRDLMRLEQAAGQGAQALEVFEGLRRTLHTELQAEPQAETLALLRELEGHEISGQTRARILGPEDFGELHLEALVGREAELETLRSRLQVHRRALIQGMAGLGKTRLAWAVAEAAGHSGGRVLWLELGGDPPEVLLAALAEALTLRVPPRHQVGTLAQALQERRVALLVLDNAANSYALGVLLEYLPPQWPVLVTSRLRLPRLPVLSLHRLPRADSLALIREYLPGSLPSDQPDPAVLDELCAVLGDHPYALRLAALNLQKSARPARELLHALRDAPHELGAEQSVKTLLGQSLQALDAESYEAYLGMGSLLTPQTTPELLALALRRPTEDTERALYSLLEHGLTSREAREGSDQITFRMHELTWHDAKAHAALQARTVVNAVRDYAAGRTKTPELLYTEVPNLIAAAQYAEKHHPDELVQLMSGWLGGKYIVAKGFPGGYLHLLRQAVEIAHSRQDWQAGSLLGAKLGDIYQALLNDFPSAIEAYFRAAEAAGKAGLIAEQAVRMCIAGSFEAALRLPQAKETLDRAYDLAEKSQDILCLCRVMNQQGVFYAMQEDYEKAYIELIKTRDMILPLINSNDDNFRDIQDRYRSVLNNLGSAARRLGRLDEAIDFHFKSLSVAKELDEPMWIAKTRIELGEVYFEIENYALASKELLEALPILRELGASGQEVTVLQMLDNIPKE